MVAELEEIRLRLLEGRKSYEPDASRGNGCMARRSGATGLI